MKKIAITLSLFLTTVFSVCGQGFGGLGNGGNNTASPRNASGEVYYQINTTTAPPMPSAASYNFTSQTFRSLTPNWKTTPPSTFTNYWRVKYVVSETNIGGGTGVPQFESPTQSTVQTQATTSVNTGTVTGTIRDLTLEGGEADKKVLKSLRGEYVNDDFKSSDSVKAFNRKVNPLEYEFLREDDWVFSEFIWREIDAREKMNQAFIYPGVDNTGDQRFLSILLNSIKNDSVWAFDPVGEGDRFTKRIYYDDIAQRINGPKEKKVITEDPNRPGVVVNDIVYYYDRTQGLDMDSVYTFRLKEQWIFDKESSRLYTRIIGICPVATITDVDKTTGKKVQTKQDLFWVFYPDLRKSLITKKVYNPKNYAGRMTREELFESRFFSSYIVKSSNNNPKSKYLQELIKNPLFRLLEGENIKERIFNYEQDLWSY